MYNTPLVELQRSPSAQIVGKLAEDSGLFLTQFEHRHHLPYPTQWLPPDRPDLDGKLIWKGGVLKEHKYLHFRYDQPLGSFHPGHRAKWTAHELCHGLVGFTWRSDMTPLAHSLAARLSELLPVTLWYFFDEVQLRRCPLHYLQGALYQDHCVYCEEVAEQGPRLLEPEDENWIHNGLKFVKAELAMISKSKRFGRPLPNRYATLDLNSDALAYVSQNIRRMEDPIFRRFIELFHGHHTGMWADLDELEGRVWGLCEALSGGLPANPLPAGHAQWIAQDLGWRLLSVSTQCEDTEAIDQLEKLAEGLASDPENIQVVFDGYEALHDSFVLPDPEDFFAVGYPLLNQREGTIWGSDYTQLFHGVDSACPSLVKALGNEGLSEQIAAFAAWDLDRPQRIPIGKRFARFLVDTASGPLADLATYESALQHPTPPDPWSSSLSWSSPEGELVRCAQGVEVLRMSVEVDTLIKALEEGDEELDIPEREYWVLICNQPGGVRRVVEISDQAAHALKLLAKNPVERRLLNLDDEDWEALIEIGALTPCSWHLYVPEVVPPRTINTDGPLPDAFALIASRGLWRQAKTLNLSASPEEDQAFEPTPISKDPDEEAQHATHHSEDKEMTALELQGAQKQTNQALKSLEALSEVIDEVRMGRPPEIRSRLMAKRRRGTQPAPSISFAAAPQISTVEALQDIGYRADRPPMNPFEEQLRQALSEQAGGATEDEVSAGFPHQGSSHDEDDEFEGLFHFEGLEDQLDDELIIDVNSSEDFLNPSEWTEWTDPDSDSEDGMKRGLIRYLDEAKIESFEDPHLDHLTPNELIDEGQQGQDVGFGQRWTDWDDE